MRRAAVLSAVVVAAALVADAAPDDLAPLRADVDALIKALDGEPVEGPSPTARMFDFNVAGETKTRAVLDEAWRIATTVAAARKRGPATRRLAVFLFPTADAKPAGAGESDLVEIDGIVRVRRAGKAPDAAKTSSAPLLRGANLRRPALPDVKRALAALDAGKVPEGEIDAVAAAVGEAAAKSPDVFRELERRFLADESGGWPMTALAASGADAAQGELTTRLASLAAIVAKDHGPVDAERLAAVVRALERCRRGAAVEAIAGDAWRGRPIDGVHVRLDDDLDPARTPLLAAAGLDVALRVDLFRTNAFASAGLDEARRALDRSLRTLCMRLIDAGGAPLSAATVVELARGLLPRIDDAETATRPLVLSAAETLLFGARPVGDAAAGLERLGPYPDAAKLLATFVKDADSGDVALYDGEPSIFDLAGAPPAPLVPRLVPDANPTRAADGTAPEQPARRATLTGEIFGQWLRLVLTNVGDGPITVDPVALRCVVAERRTEEIYGGPGAARTSRRLKLTFGALRPPAVVAAARFVKLAPKEALTLVVDLRKEDRAADHVVVELRPAFLVRGRPEAPQLAEFGETSVK